LYHDVNGTAIVRWRKIFPFPYGYGTIKGQENIGAMIYTGKAAAGMDEAEFDEAEFDEGYVDEGFFDNSAVDNADWQDAAPAGEEVMVW